MLLDWLLPLLARRLAALPGAPHWLEVPGRIAQPAVPAAGAREAPQFGAAVPLGEPAARP